MVSKIVNFYFAVITINMKDLSCNWKHVQCDIDLYI